MSTFSVPRGCIVSVQVARIVIGVAVPVELSRKTCLIQRVIDRVHLVESNSVSGVSAFSLDNLLYKPSVSFVWMLNNLELNTLLTCLAAQSNQIAIPLRNLMPWLRILVYKLPGLQRLRIRELIHNA